MFTIRSATIGDALALAPRLRSADVRELAAVSDQRPCEALLDGLSLSTFSDAVVDHRDVPVAIFGVTPFHDRGLPWLVGTDVIKSDARAFLRISPAIVRKMRETGPLLGYVHAANLSHIRWIAWSGFTLADAPEFIGSAQAPFIPFWKN